MPESIGISICERVLQDVFRRDAMTLVNVHNGISSHAFPTLVPVLYAFAQLRRSPNAFTYQFKVLDQSKNEVSNSGIGKVDALDNPNAVHKVISAFSGLIFQGPGNYSFVLEIDGKAIDSIPFIVEESVAMQADASTNQNTEVLSQT
ncbi:hypothetical protein KA183_07205 [bacterium]|nr:hypothetical protein [bacterium]